MRRGFFWFCIVLSITAVGVADAEDTFLWDGWTCGQEIPLSKIVIDAAFKHGAVLGFPGSEDVPPLLVGVLDGEHGSIVFEKGSDRWHGFAMEEVASPARLLIAPDLGRVLIFSWADLEGPGMEFTVVSARDRFSSLQCGTLPGPEALQLSDLMTLGAVEIGSSGVGTAQLDVSFSANENNLPFWASTKDWGQTWAAPTSGMAPKVVSIFQLAGADGLGPLLSDLRKSIPADN